MAPAKESWLLLTVMQAPRLLSMRLKRPAAMLFTAWENDRGEASLGPKSRMESMKSKLVFWQE